MEQLQIITAESEEALWQQIATGLDGDNILEYQAALDLNGRRVIMEIDIDPGGGFESGYEFTRFTSPLTIEQDFRFAIHNENFIDKMGKFLGMEDVVVGYPGFDDKLIIKTNDAVKAKVIFTDKNLRNYFQSLADFTLHLTHRHFDNEKERETVLELEIQRGITDLNELRQIYHFFFMLLVSMDNNSV